ncbi:tripartite motif-containing protein 16-like [Stegostoma tigrinum]|uniref:tripartite motif-containing protein 16-like n=1 Tax=Stegostoma tigrinum TaxID=3053191 RepID=UPI00202AFEA2|nr:tripartite motif-containing protein 16-like [Stegostoma tigrinum]
MSAVNVLLSEDSLVCGICLKMFKDPVTIPCGHSFCLKCIQSCWDQDKDSGGHCCPQCQEQFTPRPQLLRSHVLCRVVEDFASSKGSFSEDCVAGPDDVVCDFCTHTKLQAEQSCLVCLASYCRFHLKPHQENEAFQHHNLTQPVKKLSQRRCLVHGKALDLFCRTNQTFICSVCTTKEHKNHETVTVEEEGADRKEKLFQKEREVEARIKKTLVELRFLQQKVDSIMSSSLKVECEIRGTFSVMTEAIEEATEEVIGLVENTVQAALSRADRIRSQLEQKCDELRKEEQQLKTLSKSSDHVMLVQESLALNSSLQTWDIPAFSSNVEAKLRCASKVATDLSALVTGYLGAAIRQMKNNKIKEQDRDLPTVTPLPQVSLLHLETREDFLPYAVNLTFDPNTVNNYLHLSAGNQTVTECYPESQAYPNHPERFDSLWQVLCSESLACGKYYWEVHSQTLTHNFLAKVGVVYGRMKRKGAERSCCIGENAMSWCLNVYPDAGTWLRFSTRHGNKGINLPATRCNRIGVYLDTEAGTLSFYAFSDRIILLYRFQAVFTEPLYPAFGLYSNSSLTIQHFDH